MSLTEARTLEPDSVERAAAMLAESAAEGRAVRIRGAGTKPWHGRPDLGATVLRTTGMRRVVAFDPGDMTATLEAGVPLREAQALFAGQEQMLALDPPATGPGGAEATIGGIVATGDAGPLAHRFGGPRDLVVGMTVALGDGTIARSGGTVIKNVAGYDVAKLFCGGFGTLGLILSVNLRLHPRLTTATAVAGARDGARLCAAARRLAALPAELDALDLAWSGDGGRLLARVAGAQATARAQRVAREMSAAGLADAVAVDDDEPLWERQRAGQRSRAAAVLRVSVLPAELSQVIAAADGVEGALVARVALGQAWVTVDPEQVPRLRSRLPPGARSVLEDCPAPARGQVPDPWGPVSDGPLALMRALKQRFDPAGTCNPGLLVGGI